jgi:RHS repeat-associated protein
MRRLSTRVIRWTSLSIWLIPILVSLIAPPPSSSGKTSTNKSQGDPKIGRPEVSSRLRSASTNGFWGSGGRVSFLAQISAVNGMAVRRVNAQTRSLLAVNQISDSRLPFFPLVPDNSARDALFDVLIPPMPQSGNAKIVFTSNRDGLTQIYAMNADGSNQTRLTNSAGNDDSPRWSPNGAKIVFQSDRDHPDTGYMDIYVMNADGSGQTRLTSDANDDSMATWSPDGTKIAFQSMRNGINYQVYSMNSDGSNQVCLTNTSSSDGEPSWSPNGTGIAFASDRDHAGVDSVYVMNSNGSGQQRLTFSASTSEDTQPAWSRDGSRIAFVSTRDSVVETWQETDDDGNVITKSKLDINKEIYVMNANGFGQTRLTNDLGNDDEPSWSPDGTKIVFRSDRERDCCDPSAQVWTMNADGTNQTDLSGNGVGDYNASWTSGANQPPVANASGPYNGVAGQAVQFNGGGSFDPDGSIAGYAWNFGDGGTGSGAAPFHTYATAGTYNVVLTVTDNLGAQGSASTTATAATPNQPPVANAGGPYSGNSGTSIQLNGSASYDPDGTIATYQWTFGDGINGTGLAPAHTYSSAGTYTVTVTVTDNRGATATASASAVITSPSNQPPIANPGGPYSAVSGTPVQFNGTGSSDPDGTITQYQWNFADGTASIASPSHSFAAPGSYLVTLTVTDNGGATNSKSFNLSVAKPGGIHPESNPDDVSWDPSNRDSLDDPINKRGVAPNTTTGNNNFQVVAPVLSLPGRGLNLSLNLTYNSLVWNKSASDILFDIDHDFPAPGWQLGLGKMVAMGSAGAMIIEPDGTRHSFGGKVFDYSYPSIPNSHVPTFKGQTTDGSLIEYRCEMTGKPEGVARYPDGTVVHYKNYSTDFTHAHNYAYPYIIIGPNGSVISIKYVDPWDEPEPRIERIIDSVGRVIAFHYDSQKRLTSITGPGLPDANGAATTQTFVRLHYKTQSLDLAGAFSGLTPRVKNSNSTFSAIDAIYYPATGKGYWFGGDSYSSYGMITKVSEERGMGFSAGTSSDEQGSVSEGSVTKQQIYDYPSGPTGLTAAPSFTHVNETWDGGPSSPPVTVFGIEDNPSANERTITITNPDGTKTIQKSFNLSNLSSSDPDKFKDGLMKEQQTLDAAGHLLLKTTFAWEKGADDAPRLTRTEATDELNQVLATNYDQYGANNSVGRTREYDYDGTTVIRTSINTYLSYLDNDLDQGVDPQLGIRVVHPRRVNMVDTAKVFTGDDSANSLAAQTIFKYDEYAVPLMAYTPDYLNSDDLFAFGEPRQPNGITGILQHSGYFNPMPFNSTNGGGSGDQYITKRGNVTSIVSYADTSNSSSPATPITETRTYDMAGNVIAASKACCEQTSSGFDLPTQYGFAISETRGSADSNSLNRVTTSATYELKTGLPLSQIDANGRETRMSYYSDSLRPKEIVSPTGAHTTFEYDDVAMKVTQTTRLLLNGAITGQTVKYLSGLGQVRREEALGTNNVVDIVETIYDQFGRLSRQSRPYRSGETPQFRETAYDAAGRISEQREPYTDAQDLQLNGTITRYFYNEASRPSGASSDPGQTTRTVDPWGRSRWMRLNSRGKLAEVVEPNPVDANANGYSTKYSYDALINLIKIEQGDQVRRFHYDSIGRLTQQKLAEASATLDDSGTYSSTGGTWSDVFTYDARSNMVSRSDARGVKTLFSYKDSSGNDDPLNRVQSVSYDTSGVDTSTPTVLPAATVTYQYRTKPSVSSLVDVTQVKQTSSSGVSTEDFDYDTEGRVQEKRLTLNGRSQPMTVTYAYDTEGRTSQMTYPEQYQGTGNPIRKVVTPSYDVASRMDGLQVNSTNYASQVNYNAASQVNSLAIGSDANQLTETYQYDQKSGLLTNQNLSRNGLVLKNLAYGYQKDAPCPPSGICPDVYHSTAYTGQVTTVIDNGKYNFYSYDALGRLQHVFQMGGKSTYVLRWTEDYSYDRYGNRTGTGSAGNSGGSAVPSDGYQSLTYDSTSNRITSTGFSYDPAGNQITNGTGESFIYDAANRLAQVKDQNNVTVATYTYGASNHRLITQTGNESSPTRTYYIWDGDSVITEYTDPSGAAMPQWSKNYIYFGARLLATEEPNGVGGEIVHYHHPDRLGTRLVTNNADTTFFEQVSLPFGTALAGESTGATNRRFTSYDRSAATGLDYAVNRHYDSKQGRFTQPDPLGLGAASVADPQSLNMYSYVGNDPMNRVDPDGQFWGALFQLIIGLFHNLKPNIINGSFAYHNSAPISVSFTTNFQTVGVGYGAFGVPIRIEGHWLPELLSPKEDPFLQALWAARGILGSDNDCSRFFKGAGLDAINAIAWAVYSGRNNAYGVFDPKIGISMNIPDVVSFSNAPILLPGMYAAVAPNSVLINSNGAFGRSASFDKLPRFGGYSPGTLQSRVLQLLHEAGHLVITDVMFKTFVSAGNKKYAVYQLTHLLPLDGKPGQESLSETNTERVKKACGKEIDALKN